MTLKFDHNLETKDPAVYDIAVPEDFLIEVLPQNYSERVTVTSVKLLDENGNGVASHHFDLAQMPKVTLGISGYAKYMTQTTCKTQIRYRMVDTTTGATVYTSKGYSVSIPRNNETNLTSMTRHTVTWRETGLGWTDGMPTPYAGKSCCTGRHRRSRPR